MGEFNISFNSITIDCPNCQFQIDILIKQVVAEETIICPGCLQDIKLVDAGGSSQHSIRDVNNALEDLSKSIRKFGRG